ncbi:protein-L-isoaspartate O-methyltransferase [Streptomyces sp. NPDC057011]|uniref:protein-L-isoaspartate O-methyltransferase family protein n=1 Tax=unclassified Streptomyces TaxID=2593676 RepID=UPI00362A2EDD
MDTSLPALQPGRQPPVAPALDALGPSVAPAAGEEVNRAICREALVTAGLLREPWLARAFDTVDREAFVPQAVWLPVRDDEGLWQFVDRDEEPDVWRRAVWNPHQSVVTQLDDGDVTPGPGAGDFTSSVSALDIVMRKLQHLDLKSPSCVLEIGYGSGYHTALLCERIGSERVVAVEVDEEIAGAGASNLKAAGYDPELIVGDGLQGAPGRNPFDRIISTASLRRIPYTWIEQSRRSGVILTPFGTAYSNAGLLRLRVDSKGTTAQGWFVGESSYMWIRSERPTVDLHVPEEPTSRASPIDPAQVLGGGYLQDFAIGLQVPDVSYSHRGEGDDRQVQFVNEAGTSATIVRYDAWWAQEAVRSWGPRDLWAEVTAAYTWYELRGRPHMTRFGLTVDGGGQYAWLDEPRQLVGS